MYIVAQIHLSIRRSAHFRDTVRASRDLYGVQSRLHGYQDGTGRQIEMEEFLTIHLISQPYVKIFQLFRDVLGVSIASNNGVAVIL
jgi:hypothetical protein